ncbi:MAG: hypothetical protein NC182_02665 [Prevotella sp.]|nr:hypothetical protein [Staphylococcus sp.]MCM1350086.1 hypothetical protein [Prevotella sp.]
MHKVVPSIVPMVIVSGLVVVHPLCSKMLYPMVNHFIYFENEKALSLFMVSFFTGAPTSTILVAKAIQKKEISKQQGTLLYSTCSFISPLFLLSMVNSSFIAIIFATQLLVTIFLYQRESKRLDFTSQSFHHLSYQSYTDTLFEMIDTLPQILLKILATMCIITIMKLPIEQLPFSALAYILDVLEISLGLHHVLECINWDILQLGMTSALISINGFAIWLQVFHTLKKERLTFAPFAKTRLIHALVTTLVSLSLYICLSFFL